MRTACVAAGVGRSVLCTTVLGAFHPSVYKRMRICDPALYKLQYEGMYATVTVPPRTKFSRLISGGRSKYGVSTV